MTISFHFFLFLSWLMLSHAGLQVTLAEEGMIVEGAGYTLHDAESIKGHDEQQLEKDPVCDSSRKPKILRVEPDEAKPGQTITLKGRTSGQEIVFGVSHSVRLVPPKSITSL